MRLEAIQHVLQQAGLDGWLFFDHHHRDPLAYTILGLPTTAHVTRRWYYFIPAQGEPRALVHGVEPHVLDALPGAKTVYDRWQEQEAGLRGVLGNARRVAMQYSPQCAVPYVANVDAGTIELVRGLGVEVASAAELIQVFEARWTPAMVEMHLEAGRRVDRIRAEAFALVRRETLAGRALDEFAVQRFIMDRFAETGLITSSPPTVGVNAHTSDPHYCPSPTRSAAVRRGDLILLDLWAKLDDPDAVYYDITWTAFCGDDPPQRILDVFDAVIGARDAGVRTVQQAVAAGRTLRGFEVDDAVRGFIAARGFGQFFRHRTGHSIGRDVHGVGANMDNYETHDERTIIPGTCFSIEPGIYLRPFGIRSEIDVLVDERAARVTGEIQTELVLL